MFAINMSAKLHAISIGKVSLTSITQRWDRCTLNIAEDGTNVKRKLIFVFTFLIIYLSAEGNLVFVYLYELYDADSKRFLGANNLHLHRDVEMQRQRYIVARNVIIWCNLF